MIKQGSIIMVLWSFLLLSPSGAASLEDVLEPVNPRMLDDAVDQDAARESRVQEEEVNSTSRRLLVEASVDELDLIAEIERQLMERLQPLGTLRLIPVSQVPRLQRSATLPEVLLLTHPGKLTSSTALIRFRLRDSEGRHLGDFAVNFRVQVLADVWTPLRRMAAGEALHASDFTTREADLVREPKAVVADPHTLASYELSRAISPERALAWSDLTPRALVRKGELVEVVASGGMLSVSMKGQATRSGSLGQVVTIRNLESRREFSAEVIDEKRVRVRF